MPLDLDERHLRIDGKDGTSYNDAADVEDDCLKAVTRSVLCHCRALNAAD